jgi:hypothetical protein
MRDCLKNLSVMLPLTALTMSMGLRARVATPSHPIQIPVVLPPSQLTIMETKVAVETVCMQLLTLRESFKEDSKFADRRSLGLLARFRAICELRSCVP